MPHTNSPLITMKRLLIAGLSNVNAVTLNDEVVCNGYGYSYRRIRYHCEGENLCRSCELRNTAEHVEYRIVYFQLKERS